MRIQPLPGQNPGQAGQYKSRFKPAAVATDNVPDPTGVTEALSARDRSGADSRISAVAVRRSECSDPHRQPGGVPTHNRRIKTVHDLLRPPGCQTGQFAAAHSASGSDNRCILRRIPIGKATVLQETPRLNCLAMPLVVTFALMLRRAIKSPASIKPSRHHDVLVF